MFFVVRLWDAFADMFAGRLVDRTMTRMGKFRPFILFGAVPLLFLSYLTFHVPSSLDDGTKLLYAYVTYAVLGLVYSLVNIPYGSLASAMTQSVNERAKLVAVPLLRRRRRRHRPDLHHRAEDLRPEGQKKTLSPADVPGRRSRRSSPRPRCSSSSSAPSPTSSPSYFCREQVVRTQPRVSLRETWDTLRSNKPLGYLCAASFFYLIGLFAVGGASAFYAQYVLGDIKWLGPITLVNSGISIVAAPFIPKLVDRFGKKAIFQYCGLFTVVGGLALFFTPDRRRRPGPDLPRHQGNRRRADQHGHVRPRGRHRRVRRVEVRQALRGCDLRGLLLHPQDHPVDRWRARCRGAGLRRLPVRHRRRCPTRSSPTRAILAIRLTIGLLPALAAAHRHADLLEVPADRRSGSARSATRPSAASAGRATSSPRTGPPSPDLTSPRARTPWRSPDREHTFRAEGVLSMIGHDADRARMPLGWVGAPPLSRVHARSHPLESSARPVPPAPGSGLWGQQLSAGRGTVGR